MFFIPAWVFKITVWVGITYDVAVDETVTSLSAVTARAAIDSEFGLCKSDYSMLPSYHTVIRKPTIRYQQFIDTSQIAFWHIICLVKT
jgi:hypothetical protein